MKWEKFPSKKTNLTFLFLLFISLVFITLDLTQKIQIYKYFISYILNPVPEIALKIINRSDKAGKNIISLLFLKEENIKLKKEINRLSRIERIYREVYNENMRLKKMLELKEKMNERLIACQVISRDIFDLFRSVTVDKGIRDGIENDMPVIAYFDGREVLVGKTYSVNWTTSKVLLLTDKLFAVPAVVSGKNDCGLIEGNGKNFLSFKYILIDSNIKIGDEILTDKTSKLFPSGLFIGCVTDIEAKNEEYFKKAVVKPAVKVNNLKEVFVMKTR